MHSSPPTRARSRADRLRHLTIAATAIGVGVLAATPAQPQREPFQSFALGVDADGDVIVGKVMVAGVVRAFVWREGAMSLLDLPEGASSSIATGVSGKGDVVVGGAHFGRKERPIRWVEGVPHILPDPEGQPASGRANAVSADGSIVVGQLKSRGATDAFRWGNGRTRVLGHLGAGPHRRTVAYGVSGDGKVVVGESATERGLEAFRWRDGAMTGLGALDSAPFHSSALGASGDGAIVVGVSATAQGQQPFVWRDGAMSRLGALRPGGPGIATGISDSGGVIVGKSNSREGPQAFRWADAVMTGLGDLAGGDFRSFAFAVSRDGAVVVGRGAGKGLLEAFRWQTGAMTPLGLPEPSILDEGGGTARPPDGNGTRAGHGAQAPRSVPSEPVSHDAREGQPAPR